MFKSQNIIVLENKTLLILKKNIFLSLKILENYKIWLNIRTLLL